MSPRTVHSKDHVKVITDYTDKENPELLQIRGFELLRCCFAAGNLQVDRDVEEKIPDLV